MELLYSFPRAEIGSSLGTGLLRRANGQNKVDRISFFRGQQLSRGQQSQIYNFNNISSGFEPLNAEPESAEVDKQLGRVEQIQDNKVMQTQNKAIEQAGTDFSDLWIGFYKSSEYC